MATFHVKFLGCKVSQADAMQARTVDVGARADELYSDGLLCTAA
jgi:hypothetical protein